VNITKFLQLQFPEAEISFDGVDCSSRLVIISSQFEGLSILRRHKLVMSSLKHQFQSGEIHALSLITKTPEELSQ